MSKDLYETLGVSKDASSEEIRKSYRALALKWHPDKNHGNETDASKRFKEISQAYEILSDKTKRRQYDQRGNPPETFTGTGSSNFFNFDEMENLFGMFRNPHDIFSEFFRSDPFSSEFFDGNGTANTFMQSSFSTTSTQSGNRGSGFSESTVTTVVNGVHLTTKKTVRDGVETTKVYENGVLKSENTRRAVGNGNGNFNISINNRPHHGHAHNRSHHTS